jgi:hypothetical protein
MSDKMKNQKIPHCRDKSKIQSNTHRNKVKLDTSLVSSEITFIKNAIVIVALYNGKQILVNAEINATYLRILRFSLTTQLRILKTRIFI